MCSTHDLILFNLDRFHLFSPESKKLGIVVLVLVRFRHGLRQASPESCPAAETALCSSLPTLSRLVLTGYLCA